MSYYIKQYEGESSDGKTVYGGYGPRIFKLRDEIDQFKNITDLLTEHQSSRKAVIQIFDGIDLVDEHPEIPCTCTLQFLIRDNRLNMFTTMRSNDAFLGLPHDIFTFTMLQEIIARQLNVDLGIYTHAVGSLHLYEGDQVNAQKYIEEGYHSTKDVMPDMPFGDPWPALKILSEEEIKIRNGENINEMDLQIDDYWIDLIRLLKVYSSLRENNLQGVETLKSEMKSSVYNIYLDQKIKHIKLKP
ncbi:MAG: thymidylate synthase [Chitinophagaceae bacterium]|nr:thymidylate synthase [Chitinophagaceae bacterium]